MCTCSRLPVSVFYLVVIPVDVTCIHNVYIRVLFDLRCGASLRVLPIITPVVPGK